jgi:hypothetical protein
MHRIDPHIRTPNNRRPHIRHRPRQRRHKPPASRLPPRDLFIPLQNRIQKTHINFPQEIPEPNSLRQRRHRRTQKRTPKKDVVQPRKVTNGSWNIFVP